MRLVVVLVLVLLLPLLLLLPPPPPTLFPAITTAGGVDVCRWIINTYAWLGTDHEMWQFASHITIDPTIGVLKALTMVSQSATVPLNAAATYEFQDNLGATFAMVPGTLLVEPALDILIAAYGGA